MTSSREHSSTSNRHNETPTRQRRTCSSRRHIPCTSLLLAFVVAASVPARTCAFSAAPIVTGIGALLFPVRNSQITRISEAENLRFELEQATEFFLEAFWTAKVGGGAKKLSQAQERSLRNSQVVEFRKRYGSSKVPSELLLLKDLKKDVIIGCVGIQMDRVKDVGRAPVMSNLAIDTRYRRRGLAERLVLAAEDCAAQQFGESGCYLYVERRNRGAVKLYQKLGYKQEWTDDTARTLLPTSDGKLESKDTVILCMKKDLGKKKTFGWW